MARKDKIKAFRKIQRKRRDNRLFKRAKEAVQVKEVLRSSLNETNEYNFILYTKDKYNTFRENMQFTEELSSFIRRTITGKFKLIYTRDQWRKHVRWLTGIKLEDETDVFTVMLCHGDKFRKIQKLVDEKEPT